MSKIQSDTEHLILNADGSGKEVRFQNNGTQNVVIDSSGNVGIGTATPSNNHSNANNLVVGNGTAGGIANYVGTGLGWYAFSRDNANNTDAYDGGISYDGSRNLMFHTNAGSERMRIDGSGNVGIGTGASSLTNKLTLKVGNDDGLQIDGTDNNCALMFTDNGGTTGYRLNYNIINDRIGFGRTNQNGVYVSNLLWLNSDGDLFPATTATSDLGNPDSNLKWKDLYLSGGVYVGGTTSANYLDDYEEGTWTPVYKGESGDPTCTYDFQEGKYVKVGRLVTAKFRIGTDAASGGSGNLRVGGLPFTPVGDYSGILGAEFAFATTGTIARLGNGNTIGIRVDDDEANAVTPSILANGTNDNRLFGTIIYETDS